MHAAREVRRVSRLALLVLTWALSLHGARAQDGPAELLPAWPLPAESAAILGDYVGTFSRTGLAPVPARGMVIARDGDEYRVPLWTVDSPATESLPVLVELTGWRDDDQVFLAGEALGVKWQGLVHAGRLTAAIRHPYGGRFELRRVDRQSPTLGAPPPAGAVILLPYQPGQPTSLAAWEGAAWPLTEDGAVQVGRGDLRTVQMFGSVRLHLEFALPLIADVRGQKRANSGVFLHDRYEAQILDSWGVLAGAGDLGAIYNVSAPRVNAALPPLTWQTFDMDFEAPTLTADGDAAAPAFMTVRLNGVLVQDRVALDHPTDASDKPPVARDCIRLQDHGNPVRFRNIWLVETDGEKGAE